MARKASKATIAANLKAYIPWRAECERRLVAIGKPADTAYILKWADDARAHVEAGDCGPCTQALIRSVVRDVAAWESGLFSHTDSEGGRHYA